MTEETNQTTTDQSVAKELTQNEFYSLDKLKVSVSLKCYYNSSPYRVSVSLDQPLSPGSALMNDAQKWLDQDQPLSPGSAFTLRYLRDKGEKIRLIVTFHKINDGTASALESGTIDLSKPDSNGNFNFNFQGVNAYCSFDPSDSKFIVYSDAFEMYSGVDYDSGYMQVLYSD